MDLVKDVPHNLTKIDIPVLGSGVIDGPKLFEFLDNTLGTARTLSGVNYLYVTRRCILTVNDRGDLFRFFKHFEEGKENKDLTSINEEHMRC